MKRLFWHQLPEDVKYELDKYRKGEPHSNDGPLTLVEWTILAYSEYLVDKFDKISYDLENELHISDDPAQAYKDGVCVLADHIHDYLDVGE